MPDSVDRREIGREMGKEPCGPEHRLSFQMRMRILIDIGCVLLVLAGLLLPGITWVQALRIPGSLFAAGAFSFLGIFAGVLLLSIAGISISFPTLAAWLVVWAVAGWCLRPVRRVDCTPPAISWKDCYLAWPAVPMIVVAVWRATLQPLSGPDIVFRWDHLAQLIVQTGHMRFYPPVSPEAFARYFWADGIAPLVSSLYVWTYLAAGDTGAAWTAIPVLLQVCGLCSLAYHAGALYGGPRGGWLAISLAGATMLLQFAFGLGQETGLTALGACGMVFYLACWRRSNDSALLIPAAVCGALVACAREYGPAFLIAGICWVWVQPNAGKVAKCGFAFGAAALPVIWHFRNWWMTGNPLYAHGVGGMFPTNDVFQQWMHGYQRLHGRILTTGAGWWEIFRLILMGAIPALAGFAAGAFVWRKHTAWSLGIMIGALSVGLWLVSVPFTAGGVFYSMRVLSPLMLWGCAWGGACLARAVPVSKHLGGVMIALGLFGLDAALRAWTLPTNPYSVALSEWPSCGYQLQLDFERDDRAFLEKAAHCGRGRVLSDSAGVQPIFEKAGRDFVPFWSPDVAFLFSSGFHGDAVSRLRAAGYTHLLLKRAQFTVDFLRQTGALERFDGRLRPVAANDAYVFFELTASAGGASIR